MSFGAKALGIPLGCGHHLGPLEPDQGVISPSEVTLPFYGTEALPDPAATVYLNSAFQQNLSL